MNFKMERWTLTPPPSIPQILVSVIALAFWDTLTHSAPSVGVQPTLRQSCSPGRSTGRRWMSGLCECTFLSKTCYQFLLDIKLWLVLFHMDTDLKGVFLCLSGVNMYAMLTGTLPFTVEPFSLRALHQKMVDKEMNPLPPSLSTGD